MQCIIREHQKSKDQSIHRSLFNQWRRSDVLTVRSSADRCLRRGVLSSGEQPYSAREGSSCLEAFIASSTGRPPPGFRRRPWRRIIPSNRYMSTGSNFQSPRKELAIALMKEPVTNGDANQEIRSIDELLDLLKVDAKSEDDQPMQTVAAEARRVIGKKKQELAFLVLKEEVEGVDGHGYKEEVTEELVAAARRLRDSLLPQAQRWDLWDLKKKYASLEDQHYTLILCLWLWGLPVTSLLLILLHYVVRQ